MRPRRWAVAALSALAAAALWSACGRRARLPVREFGISFSPPDPPSLVGAGALGDSEQRLWRAAARAAADVVGADSGCPPVRVRFEPPPAGGGEGILGESRGGSIAVVASPDPLKTAFRAGHECAHALLACRYGPGMLPLWLEEGLAQLAGDRAAEAVARGARLQSVRVPPPGPWFSLGDLLSLSGYPSSADGIAAFYWQSSLLVRALHARLGPAVFSELLASVAAGAPCPDFLRTRCWFAEADFEWLRRQIAPGAPPPAPASAGWLL